MLRTFIALMSITAVACVLALSAPATQAQDASAQELDPRSSTGGAQTLEDILARQRGEIVDDSTRRDTTGDPDSAAGMASQLGTLGGASNSDVFRALRYGTADVTVTSGGPAAGVLIQDGGMRWLQFRQGPLATYGGYLLLGVIGLLLLFYLVRGRIRIDGEKTGETIQRFNGAERFAHWLLASSFILLGITGLLNLLGKTLLVLFFAPRAMADGIAQTGVLVGGSERHGWELLGATGYDAAKPYLATALELGKWVHNNVSWAFMLALVLVFIFWVVHNIPNRHDMVWMMKGGGLLTKGSHPPAKKFNAGQKLIFWAVIVLGASISVSGLALLFPFEMPMFAVTFEKLNAIGVPGWLNMAPFPTELSPHEEMQFSQLWHAIVSFVLMSIIIAHIYLGSIGMEGAFDAMGSGEVEKQWAKEHHNLWVEEVEAAAANAQGSATPAE